VHQWETKLGGERREGRYTVRLIKMLGLTAVTAIAAMAFLGASTAMATNTLLCMTDDANCASPTLVNFESVNAAGTAAAKAVLLNSIINVECNAAIVGHRISDALPTEKKPVTFEGLLSYTNCSSPCSVTVISNGTISVLRTTNELADVTASGFKVKVNCAGFFICDYNAANLVGHGLGGLEVAGRDRGHVTFGGNLVNLEQDLFSPFGNCPATANLDALFQSSTDLFIKE
jgi:hypothetical protein